MCTVKEGKNESNTFGEGWGTFPPTPPQKARFRGIWGGAAGGDDLLLLWSRRSDEKKERVREKRPARARILALSRQPAWRDRLVAPVHVARQGGPRHRRRGAALARAASGATLSRHMHWHDRGHLSRHAAGRDQTGYALQIKTNTG